MAKHKTDKTTMILIWVTAMIIILIAGGITAVVLNNRFHTERDNALAEQQAKQKQADAEKASQQHLNNSLALLGCKSAADKSYWDYVALNATSSHPGDNGSTVYIASHDTWDTADSHKQQAYNDCYRQYPAN